MRSRGDAGRSRVTEKGLARGYIHTLTADKHRSGQQEGQSGQDLPIAFRHPPERQEPPYHPTQREEEVERGESERERKQDIHVKHAEHKHGDGTSTETETWTDVSIGTPRADLGG